jgi:hypothetical protein
VHKFKPSAKKKRNGHAPQKPPSPPAPPPVEGNEDHGGDYGSNSITDHTKHAENQPHWTSYVEAFCAILLVLITAFYTYYAGHQAQSAIDATRIATKSMLIDQRAWIGLDHIDIVDAPIQAGKNLRINVTFKNTGKTPSFALTTIPISEGVEAGQKPHFDYSGVKPIFYGLVQPNAPVLSSYIPFRNLATMAPIPITQSGIDQLRTGKTTLYIHGRIDYRDAFRTAHWTEFCYYLLPTLVEFESCPTHNNADDYEPNTK